MESFYNNLSTSKNLDVNTLLGFSHDGFIDKTKGQALDVTIRRKETAPKTVFHLHVLETTQDFEKLLSMSASAKVKSGFAAASGKASFRENININSYELNVIIQSLVTLPPYEINEYDLNQTFKRYIYKTPKLIDDKYGLSYIKEITFGGELLIIFNIKTKNESHFRQMSAKLKAKAGPISGKAKFEQTITEISGESFTSLKIWQNSKIIPELSLAKIIDYAISYPATITDTNSILLEYSTMNLKSIPLISGLDYNELFDLDFKNDQKEKLELANDLYEKLLNWQDKVTYVINNIEEFDEIKKQQAESDYEYIKNKKKVIIKFIYNCREIENNKYLDKFNECIFESKSYKRKDEPVKVIDRPTPIVNNAPQVREQSRPDVGDRGPGGRGGM
ncbi:MAG: hypothetical protein K2Y30_16155 [Flavobacteriaceae bacterium]|nr:hypothetical protein [Flavobacteriaceae bacterium]